MNRTSSEAELRPDAIRAVERARAALKDRRARPNLRWLLALSGATIDQVSDVLVEAEELVPVEAAIRGFHSEGGRPYYAQFRAPFELYAFVRLLRPDHVIETGVSSGVSSAHFLLGLRRNGKGVLHSIDLPTPQLGPKFSAKDSPVALPPGRETGWAVPSFLRSNWDLHIGASEQVLPRLVRGIDSVGLFLHDSLHSPSHLAFELKTVRPKLVPGAVVLADNTIWTGAAFPRFAAALGARMLKRGRTDLVGLRVPSGASRVGPRRL
jgi:Methyltransferase domain